MPTFRSMALLAKVVTFPNRTCTSSVDIILTDTLLARESSGVAVVQHHAGDRSLLHNQHLALLRRELALFCFCCDWRGVVGKGSAARPPASPSHCHCYNTATTLLPISPRHAAPHSATTCSVRVRRAGRDGAGIDPPPLPVGALPSVLGMGLRSLRFDVVSTCLLHCYFRQTDFFVASRRHECILKSSERIDHLQ